MVRRATPWTLRGTHAASQSATRVCCAEFFYGQGDKLFLWLAFDEDRPLFFCVFARAFFFLKKSAGGDPPGLAPGNKVGRHAVPRDPWPSWVVDYCGASGGSLTFFPAGLRRFLGFGCCFYYRCLLPI